MKFIDMQKVVEKIAFGVLASFYHFLGTELN